MRVLRSGKYGVGVRNMNREFLVIQQMPRLCCNMPKRIPLIFPYADQVVTACTFIREKILISGVQSLQLSPWNKTQQ